MSVKLVSKTEKFVYDYDGAKFYYRRISANDVNQLRKKHTSTRGVLDDVTFGENLLGDYVIGWENVLGDDSKPVAFDKELIYSLPSPLLIELISRINGEIGSDEEISGEKLEKK